MNKKGSWLALALSGVLALNLCTPVRAEDKPDEGTKKEETVYAFLDWQGQLKSATVSEWLHNEQGFRQTADQSILENIKNINGDDLPEQNGTSLVWNSDEHDLYYQGTTTAELPLTMEVSYQFNGKTVDPHEIVGQSGSLTITIKLINHLETTETINGKTKYISTLFPCAIVTDLPTETFKDVKAEDGLILNESKNQIVALATVSGMSQMLRDSDVSALDDVKDKLKDEFVITANVENFEMPSIILAAAGTSNLEDKEIDRSDLDKLTDGVDDLKDATAKILDGTVQLHDANIELNDKMGEFQSKYKEFSDGLNTAATSSKALKEGAQKLSSGVGQIQTQLTAMLQNYNLTDEQLMGLLQQLNGSLTQLQGASALMEQLAGSMQALATMPQATGDAIRAAGQSEAFNDTWAGVTEQVRAGVKQNLPPVNVEIDQNALVSAIGSALAEQGVAEEQIPALTQAIAGKVGEQLNSQLGAAQEMIAAGLGQAVDAGVDTMSSYGKQAAVGTVDQIAQTVQDTMSAKVQEMAGLMSQAQQLTTEMTAMINNINGMIEQIGGVDELKNALAGLQQLPEGLKDLKEGTDQLAAGTAAMNAGLDKLNGASGDITDAINKFKDATQELAEKTGELNDGVDEFSREGIDELSGKVTDAMDDLNDVLDTAKAALDQSKEYRSYAGAADTMETSVKFIMKTDEIKLPEEKTTAVETKTEVKTSFWDRVKNLFH